MAQTDTLNIAISQKAKVIAERLQRELSLTADQTKQVLKISLERFDNLKLENQTDLARFDRVNKKAQSKLASILTKEQYQQYLNSRAETKKQKDDYLKTNPNTKPLDADLELDF
jgi:hypothetical protein